MSSNASPTQATRSEHAHAMFNASATKWTTRSTVSESVDSKPKSSRSSLPVTATMMAAEGSL